MATSVFAPAKGPVTELALVFTFGCQRSLSRRGCRGRRRREDCYVCTGHLDVVGSRFLGVDGDRGRRQVCDRNRAIRPGLTARWLNIVWFVECCYSRSRSRLLALRLRALPWGLKGESGDLERDDGHWI
jgi:hypothetical protein